MCVLLDEIIRWETLCGSWPEGMVQGDNPSSGSNILEEIESDDDSNRGGFHSGDNGHKRKKRSVFDTVFEKTTLLLKKYPCSPSELVMQRQEFRSDMVLINPRNQIYVNAALDHFGHKMNSMSLRELYDFYNSNDCEPVFNASNNYYSLEESVEHVNKLLIHQCNDDIEDITKFLSACVNVLDKKLPKCNTILIHSPPSAGKNWFFDMIFAFCLSYGQFGMANRHNQFAFQDAPNKRVILWDEPNYESCLTDLLKLIFGGGSYKVRVKSARDTPVSRTPVVVLTNNIVDFMVDMAFYDRIIQFRWKEAPFLADLSLKPYPLAFFEILKKYHIDF